MSRTISSHISAAAISCILSSSAFAQEALPTIDVGADASSGTANRSGPRGGRENPSRETGYRRTIATTATKTDTPILDTPRSVVVIPKEMLHDNQVLNVQEAVKFVSGVQTAGAAYYDRYLIRGFQSGFTYRDGLKLYNVSGSEDVAFIDRVEILKGPSAMLYGRIQPGGLVNFVTKKPEEQAAYSVEEQFGSWGLSRTIADATGPLDKDKTLLYRVIGVYDHADDFVNFLHRDNGAVLGALTWKPTEQFESNFQVEYYNGETTNRGYYRQMVPALALSYAVPGFAGRPASLPRNWSQNDPNMYGQYPDTLERIVLYADWTYRLSESWKISNKIHFDHNNEDQEFMLSRAFDLSTGNMYRRASWNLVSRDTWSLDLNINGKLKTGPLAHNLLVGFDYFDYHDVGHGDNPQGKGPETLPFNVFAPFYGGVSWPAIQAEHYLAQGNLVGRTKAQDVGYYAQDDISYDNWAHLLLGGRYDIAYDATSEIYGVSSASGAAVYGSATAACFPICDGHYNPPWKGNPTERRFSPNIGILFKLTPEYSFFASYSESFGFSNSAISFDGSAFPPQKGEQWEGGVKASLFDGRLTGSIVYFDLTMSNQLTADPVNPGFSVATGKVRSRGVEFDGAGQITDNISLFGSYTYDDAIIISDNTTGTGASLGKRWPGVPRHAGNLWTKYDTAPGLSEGWTFGAGFYANGERQGNNTNSFQLPGYVRVDTMVGYRTVLAGVPVEAQLNVKNINDARYFEATGGGIYSYYGAPRTFVGSLKVKF